VQFEVDSMLPSVASLSHDQTNQGLGNVHNFFEIAHTVLSSKFLIF
jgi:hypothetical protein